MKSLDRAQAWFQPRRTGQRLHTSTAPARLAATPALCPSPLTHLHSPLCLGEAVVTIAVWLPLKAICDREVAGEGPDLSHTLSLQGRGEIYWEQVAFQSASCKGTTSQEGVAAICPAPSQTRLQGFPISLNIYAMPAGVKEPAATNIKGLKHSILKRKLFQRANDPEAQTVKVTD